MAFFGSTLIFDHRSHQWNIYISRFKQYCTANNISEENDKAGVKRRALLLTSFAEDTYRIAKDLAYPTDLENIEYSALLQKLTSHFIVKKSTFAERYVFYKAEQHPGEDLTEWAARVRSLAQHCEFKSDLDTALRDRFVLGLENNKEKEKLFAENIETLSFNKALELASNIRCARLALHGVEDASIEPATSHRHTTDACGATEVFAVRASATAKLNNVKPVCAVCGYRNHSKNECRFANYTCRKCNVKGHLQRMCGKKITKNNNFLNKNEDDIEKGDLKCFNIKCINGAPMTETVNRQRAIVM